MLHDHVAGIRGRLVRLCDGLGDHRSFDDLCPVEKDANLAKIDHSQGAEDIFSAQTAAKPG